MCKVTTQRLGFDSKMITFITNTYILVQLYYINNQLLLLISNMRFYMSLTYEYSDFKLILGLKF